MLLLFLSDRTKAINSFNFMGKNAHSQQSRHPSAGPAISQKLALPTYENIEMHFISCSGEKAGSVVLAF